MTSCTVGLVHPPSLFLRQQPAVEAGFPFWMVLNPWIILMTLMGVSITSYGVQKHGGRVQEISIGRISVMLLYDHGPKHHVLIIAHIVFLRNTFKKNTFVIFQCHSKIRCTSWKSVFNFVFAIAGWPHLIAHSFPEEYHSKTHKYGEHPQRWRNNLWT